MTPIRVDNRLRVPKGLPEPLMKQLRADCTHTNPEYHKAKAMGFKWTKEKPIIETWAEDAEGLSLPRGRTAELRAALEGKVELVDERLLADMDDLINHPHHQVDLWEHQERIVRAIIDIEQGIVHAPTGSGKTTAAIAAIVQAKLPTLIIVWNSGLLKQWVERLEDELGLDEEDIGVIGGGTYRIRPITVAMQQTLASSPKKLREATQTFGFVCCDEVQRFAAKTFTKVVDAFPARYRIGLSADSSRKDRKEFLIHDMFGKVIAEVTRKEMEAKNRVVPVDIVIVPTEFEADWYREQMEREGERPDFNALLEAMTHDRERNELAVELATKEMKPTMMLTHRREHAMELQARVAAKRRNCGVLLGGTDDKAAFDDAVFQMRNRKLNLSVGTYQAVGVGLDIKPLERAVCTTPIHSNRQFFNQVRGRICRTSVAKTSATMFYLWDRKVFGPGVLHNLSRWNDQRVLVRQGEELISLRDYMETIE